MRKLFLALGASAILATAAGAASIPSSGHLSFDVIRGGKDISDHTYSFSQNGSQLTVDIATDVTVKLPILGTKLYSFQHRSRENWQGGRLAQIQYNTNDNGKPNSVNISNANLVPASLWNDQMLTQRSVLNTVDGKEMSISAVDLGAQNVHAAGRSLRARHYRVSGDLQRDLWYDPTGLLVKVGFTADDGSAIQYLLK
jgi:hypothetical protein